MINYRVFTQLINFNDLILALHFASHSRSHNMFDHDYPHFLSLRKLHRVNYLAVMLHWLIKRLHLTVLQNQTEMLESRP